MLDASMLHPNAHWFDPGPDGDKLPNLYATHEEYADGGVSIMQRKRNRPGLLELTVRFRVKKLVDYVLTEPKLHPERAPFSLQQGFQRALTLHAVDLQLDLGIIEALIEHGARVEEHELAADATQGHARSEPWAWQHGRAATRSTREKGRAVGAGT